MANERTHRPAQRILIVDDEIHVRRFLRLSLQMEQFNVIEAASAEEALTLLHSAAPDLMVLDLGLPDLDGRQVIRDVRQSSDMPILVLSGSTEDSVKIATLEQGADDYMTKPFAIRDVIMRIRAALRHVDISRRHDTADSMTTGNLQIGLQGTCVKVGQQPIELANEEYEILRMLAMHGGRVMTYNRMARKLWGHDSTSDSYQEIQRRISRLRGKIELEPAFPRYIVTEPMVGYRLEILPVTPVL